LRAPSPFRSDKEFEIVQQTIYAEARGEPLEGQKAVAWVIYNRAKKGVSYFGKTMQDVCLKPYQFECWFANVKPTWHPPKETQAYNKIGGWLKTVFNEKDCTVLQRCGVLQQSGQRRVPSLDQELRYSYQNWKSCFL